LSGAGGVPREASIGLVHIRRALLLFAIVLGLAAIAASVSRSPEDSGDGEPAPVTPSGELPSPSVSAGDAPAVSGVRELVFDAERDQTRRLATGQPATVLVEVEEAGLVEIADLGLSAPAEPLTPARFEILRRDPDRLAITFTAAQDDFPGPAGTLVVKESAEG
jgi:hypothetical protein